MFPKCVRGTVHVWQFYAVGDELLFFPIRSVSGIFETFMKPKN